MTLFEAIIVANILVSAYCAYQLGQMNSDIEILYEGLAGTIAKMEGS